MKKIILFYLIVSALSIADDVNIDLGDSVIRKNYSERDFLLLQERLKTPMLLLKNKFRKKTIKMLRMFLETHLEL